MQSETDLKEGDFTIHENYMLISKTGRVCVLDLTSEDYQIVKEISTADDLYDPQKYVMNGLNPHEITNISSSYYLHNNQMYRTFSEIDLAEVERVSTLKTALSVIDQKFDINALFASFKGRSLFSIFDDNKHLLKAILTNIESKQYGDAKDGA